MVPSVSPKTERASAKVMTVSRESPAAPIGDATSALTHKSHIISLGHFLRTSQNIAIPTIRIHGLKYLQGNYVRNCWDKATHQHSQRRRCGGRRRAPEGPEGLAAVPVGGGGAWPGFETTRRAKLAARTARGRAAAHGHTEQPGPTAGPSGARNTSGATRPRGHAKGAGTAVPAPLSAHSATASSRLRPNDPQSWRRRRIHRNIPPTTAAPRPAPPIRPSKPVRARRWVRPVLGLVAGTSGAT